MHAFSLSSVRRLTDRALLGALRDRLSRDRELEAELLALLSEVDARQLYLEAGYPSMFEYCQRALHLTEWIAFHRIRVARAVRAFPVILERIRQGEIHLSGVKLLAPHLTKENHWDLLEQARHKSKAQIEELLADRAPKPDAPSLIRKLPARAAVEPDSVGAAASGSSASSSAGRGPGVEPPSGEPQPLPPASMSAETSAPVPDPKPAPLGGGRYKVQFTADPELHAKLREAQALLRHQVPDGDPARIINLALTSLLSEVKRKKFAETSRPRSQPDGSRKTAGTDASRHIPAAIKREVVARVDEGCGYLSPDGRRCGSREFLEFEHTKPWARFHRHRAGEIELRCRAHNQYAAQREYGRAHMERCRTRTGSGTSSRASTGLTGPGVSGGSGRGPRSGPPGHPAPHGDRS